MIPWRKWWDKARTHWVIASLLCLPLLLFILGPLLVVVLPHEQVFSAILVAVVLSGWRWAMVFWVFVGFWMGYRHRRLGLSGLLVVLGFLGMGWPFSGAGEGYLIVSANVQAYASGQEQLEKRLAQERADVVLAIEKRAEEIDGMLRVVDNFDRDLPKPSHGMAFFCREGLECAGWVSPEIGVDGCSMPVALLRLEQKMCVVGVHVPPPVPICATGVRPYISWLAERIEDGRMTQDEGPCERGDPVLAIGDFNATPGSWAVNRMLAQGLRDPLRHRGIYAATWPAGGGWPNLPFFRLDHVFPGALKVTGVQTFRLPQSDHKALRVWATPEE